MSKATSQFNWSLLDRNGIIKFLMSISPELIGKELTVDQFHKKITTHIKKFIPVRFKKNRNYKVESNQIWVGGTYYSEWDQDKQKCIELLFVYPLFEENICISKKRYKGMCSTIADTIFHELIHMRQYRRRKFKIISDYASTANKTEVQIEQSYLGCSDEIDAYGFNIACELMDKFNGDEQKIFAYLAENQKGVRRRHNSWRMYLKAFQHDHNHPIVQRLKKKIVRYLPMAQIGKPYRNKDWISR
jgi:hypothetical protein